MRREDERLPDILDAIVAEGVSKVQCPLNPPILGDFLFRFPENWGLGGLFETFRTPSYVKH